MKPKLTNREAAIQIVKRLRQEGFEALLAGGCVRDMLLGRTAKDYDVATSAVPEEVVGLFKWTLEVGAQFGVVMVRLGGQQVEVATFRTEDGYADGRHPSHVAFSTSREDAGRRDFTVNGMFYDPIDKRVIDFVDGQKDIKAGILRAIGDPDERFSEDYLRMLRAVRFSTQLGFDIEENTWKAVCKHAGQIQRISAERIAIELEGILTYPDRHRGMRLLMECGLGEEIFGSISKAHVDCGLAVLGELRKEVDFPLALAAFLVSSDAPNAVGQAKKLKLSGAQQKHLKFLLQHRGVLLEELSLARLKMLLSEPYFWDLYELQRAIQRARGEAITKLTEVKRRVEELAGKEIKPKPLLDGHELIGLGAQPGPMVGLVGQEMYVAQLGEEIHTKAEARKWVSQWLEKHRALGE